LIKKTLITVAQNTEGSLHKWK